MPRALLIALLIGVTQMGVGFAQPSAKLAACCAITTIDAASGVVSAQEASTGHRFRFEVKDRVVLRGLKVGQKVFADFATGKVAVGPEPAAHCCAILPSTTLGVNPKPNDAAPCCGIVAIDPAAKLVTARLKLNGLTFRFRVNDATLLGTLKLGQDVWASKESAKAGVKAGDLCCPIVTPLPTALP